MSPKALLLPTLKIFGANRVFWVCLRLFFSEAYLLLSCRPVTSELLAHHCCYCFSALPLLFLPHSSSYMIEQVKFFPNSKERRGQQLYLCWIKPPIKPNKNPAVYFRGSLDGILSWVSISENSFKLYGMDVCNQNRLTLIIQISYSEGLLSTEMTALMIIGW